MRRAKLLVPWRFGSDANVDFGNLLALTDVNPFGVLGIWCRRIESPRIRTSTVHTIVVVVNHDIVSGGYVVEHEIASILRKLRPSTIVPAVCVFPIPVGPE
jgi:hypothetical protein